MQSHKTNRKKSSHFNEKIWIREEALRNVEKANVLDCFHGEGKLWGYLCETQKNIDSVTGIEIKKLKSKFPVIHDNNENALKEIILDKYNVFDLDAYGYPVKQMDILFKRIKKESVIIYTICISPLAKIPEAMNVAKDITDICKTIITRFSYEMFVNYLYRHGIQEYHEYCFENKSIKKYYGYFLYNPKNDLTRKTI